MEGSNDDSSTINYIIDCVSIFYEEEKVRKIIRRKTSFAVYKVTLVSSFTNRPRRNKRVVRRSIFDVFQAMLVCRITSSKEIDDLKIENTFDDIDLSVCINNSIAYFGSML